ncbi:MAG: hypothetical protein IPH00_11685 [Flavobacteriales bacterium]|nr:hypothetical protein [Flavobacteriales bacterium]
MFDLVAKHDVDGMYEPGNCHYASPRLSDSSAAWCGCVLKHRDEGRTQATAQALADALRSSLGDRVLRRSRPPWPGCADASTFGYCS